METLEAGKAELEGQFEALKEEMSSFKANPAFSSSPTISPFVLLSYPFFSISLRRVVKTMSM